MALKMLSSEYQVDRTVASSDSLMAGMTQKAHVQLENLQKIDVCAATSPAANNISGISMSHTGILAAATTRLP
jgi:hypothetical protein